MDFLIRNGLLYDPAAHRLIRKDVALVEGKIVYPAVNAGSAGYRQIIDASGCLVTPGLIDYHTHYCFRGSENGVNGDAASFCMGITTAVDGGSAGTGNYELYRASIMAMAEVRILNYLLVASGGQSNDQYPENLDPRYLMKERFWISFSGMKTIWWALKRGFPGESWARKWHGNLCSGLWRLLKRQAQGSSSM